MYHPQGGWMPAGAQMGQPDPYAMYGVPQQQQQQANGTDDQNDGPAVIINNYLEYVV